MHPEGAFTLERIHGFAALALERAQARLIDEGLVFDHLTCEYRGVAAADGVTDLQAFAPCGMPWALLTTKKGNFGNSGRS